MFQDKRGLQSQRSHNTYLHTPKYKIKISAKVSGLCYVDRKYIITLGIL